MRKFLNSLALMLCFALLATTVPADLMPQYFAYAEEAAPAAENTPEPTPEPAAAPTEAPTAVPTEAPTETPTEVPTEAPTETPTEAPAEVPTEVPAETPAELPTELPSDVPSAEPTAEVSAAPETSPEITTDPNAVDYTADASESPAFDEGFAQLRANGVSLYDGSGKSAEELAAIGAGVVYAFARSASEPDRLEIAFNAGGNIETGWVDAVYLRPMDPESEVADYINSCENDEDVACYKSDGGIPLRPIEFTPVRVLMFAAAAPVPVNEPDAIYSDYENYELYQTQTVNLSDLVYLPEGTESSYTYSIDNEAIASVDENGVLLAKASGEALATITTANEKSVSIRINVLPAIEMKPLSLILAVGETGRSVSAQDMLNGSAITFASSDDTVLTIDAQTGDITVEGKGNAIITASTTEGLSAECTVSVLPAPQQGELTALVTEHKMGVGEKVDVNELISIPEGMHAVYTYNVGSTRYASVNSSGVVTAKAKSTTSVTITAHTGASVTIPLKIYSAPRSVSANPSKLSLGVTQTSVVAPKFASGYYADYFFESEFPEIVSVDRETGEVKALSEGTARIKVETSNGRKGFCTVTVFPAPAEIGVENADILLGVGEPNSYVKGVNLTEGSLTGFTYASSSEAIVTVDKASGLLTPVAMGSATITVTSSNGLTAEAKVTVVPAPQEGEITALVAEHKMGVGEKIDLNTLISVPEGTHAAYTYKVKTSKYASVTADGVLTAKTKSTTSVTITAHTGASVTIPLKIYYAPRSVSANPAKLSLGVTQTSVVAPKFASGYYADYFFESEFPEIVSVDRETGEVKALSEGTARIKVETSNGRKGFCTVTVFPAPTEIGVENVDILLGVGEPNAYVKGVNLTEGSLTGFTYASSNEAIVTVDKASGLLTPVAMGSATITVTSSNGLTAEAKVTVVPAPQEGEIVALVAEHKMGVGEKIDLKTLISVPEGTHAAYTYKVKTSKYASVTADGVLTAKTKSTTSVTITAHTGASVTIPLKIYSAPRSVSANPSKLSLGVTQTSVVAPKFASGYYADYFFESEFPEIVSVDRETGEVKALSEGTARIKVETTNGKKGFCTVTVLPAPTEIGVENADILLGVGEPNSYIKGVNLTEGSLTGFTYASSSEAIVTVDETSGLLTPVAMGSATITVTSSNGLTAEAKVTVVPAPQEGEIVALVAEHKMGVGEKIDLKTLISVPEGTHAAYTYKVKTSKYASVTADGVLTAKTKSTTSVTITAHTGASVTIPLKIYSAPRSVSANPAKLSLGVTQTATIAPKFASGYYADYFFESEFPEIVSVDRETGEVKALSEGTARIKVETSNGRKGFCTVTVLPAPAEIGVENADILLGVGEPNSYVKGVNLTEGSLTGFTYASSSEAIVTVDETSGLLTPVAMGSATITVTSSNGLTAEAKVTVVPAPQEGEITALVAEHKMGVGEKIDLKTLISVPEGTHAAYTYKVKTSKYASVTADGVLTAKTKSTTSVTITAHTGASVTIPLKIYSAPRSVSANPAKLSLGVTQTATIAPKFASGYYADYFFESEFPEIVSVDRETGEVKALSEGTARIKVETSNGRKGFCTVTVFPAPAEIGVENADILLGVGEPNSYVKGINLTEGSLTGFTYASSSEAIVTVDKASGLLTPVEMGSATITVTSSNGLTAEAKVTVVPAPQEGEITALVAEHKMGVGEKIDLKTLISVPEGTHAAYTYKVKTSKYASVTADGVLTAKTKSTTSVTITAHTGASVTIPLKIYSAPRSVSANPAKLSLGVTQTATIAPKFASGYYADYFFESEFPEIVSVDRKTGEVKALSVGSARIKVETSNGRKGFCTVTVFPAPAEIGVENADILLGVGEPNSYVKGVNLTEGSLTGFTYASSSEAIVTVDKASGLLTPVAMGSATITVTSSNGLTAEAKVTVVPQPDSIEANCSRIHIGVKEKLNAADFVKIPDGTHTHFSYTSKSTRYAKVDASGVITGVRAGSTQIGVKTQNGDTVYIPITIYSAPKKVTIAPKTLLLSEGMEASASATITTNSASALKYVSSDESVATVDLTTGRIKAVGAGEATITVSTFNNLSDTLKITVKRAPTATEIWAVPSELTLGAGEDTSSVKGEYAEGTLTSFVYSSSDPETVYVDPVSGALEAIKPGTAVIFATAHNGEAAQCTVTVLNEPETLTLSHTELTIMVGESNTDIKAHCEEGAACGTLTYASQDTSIVQVRDNALVGVAPGTAKITATTYNGIPAECTVTVKPAPTDITMACDAVKLGIGEAFTNPVSITEGSYSVLRSKISDENVLSYDMATGEITGLAIGDATITVSTLNGLSAECKVSVYAAPSSVTVPESLLLSAGMSAQLEASFAPNTYSNLTYTLNSDCIEIDERGMIRAIKEGSCVVTATTYNGHSDRCTVAVGPAPAVVSYGTLDEVTIARGDTVKIPLPSAYYADGTDALASYTFSAAPAGIVQIDNESGTMTALAAGSVELTAVSHNDLFDNLAVNVVEEISGITLSDTSKTLYVNDAGYAESFQLSCELDGVDLATLTYTSSDRNVAYVDENGLVTALAPGKTTISVTTCNELEVSCHVTVHALSSTIAFESNTLELGLGEKYRLNPVFEEGASARVSYSGGNSKISVDESGLVHVLAMGEATITATTQLDASASVKIVAIPAPTGISLDITGITLRVGESVKIEPALSGSGNYRKVIYFKSENSAVAGVTEDGTITAISEGSAIITAETCSGLVATCTIEVSAADAAILPHFGDGEFSIVVGDEADLPLMLTVDAIERGYTISTESELLSVNGRHITAGTATGDAVVTLTIDGDAAVPEGETAAASCIIHVIDDADLILSTENLNMSRNAEMPLYYDITPVDLIGTFKWEIKNPSLISYDDERGIVTSGDKFGETDIVFTLKNVQRSCRVTVFETTYRSLVIAEYHNTLDQSKNLPFATNNIEGITSVLTDSSVLGGKYHLTTSTMNPSKAQIRSLLSSTFRNAGENDINFIYLLSHGHNNVNGFGTYGFSLPGYANSFSDPDTYVTSYELMDWLSDIPGKVVLVLTSCYSGGFIDDSYSQLVQAGNISVVCSSHKDTNSSYFYSTTPKYNVDTFTYSLLYGLGYDEQEDTFHDLLADSNGDGLVSVQEAFFYSASKTRSTISEIRYKSGFRNSASQYPQYFIADGMGDLPIIGRAPVFEEN